MDAGRTIVAVASARGPSQRGIVRLSGPQSVAFVSSMFSASPFGGPAARGGTAAAGLHEGSIELGCLRVPCTLWLRLAPRSFTGEDCAELHVPGAPLLLAQIVQHLCDLGAERAAPGEFTRLAFAHGKLDLSQAEAVAQLTAAAGEAERRVALALLAGGLSRRLLELEAAVHHVLIPLELGFDFSDQDVLVPLPEDGIARLGEAAQALEALAEQGRAREAASGRRLVLLRGLPNAGKSTLFNALVGSQRALVSGEAGTTRDLVYADAECLGMALTFVDSAGADVGCTAVELAAQAARENVATQADLLLEVQAGTQAAAHVPMSGPRSLSVWTHADLGGDQDGLHVCALNGLGMDALRAAIHAALRQSCADVGVLNLRQAEACREAAAALRCAASGIGHNAPGELVAADLHAALRAASALSGRDAPGALLDRIFSGFCIGK